MKTHARRCSYSFIFAVMITVMATIPVAAQDTVTGAFEGVVTSSLTGEPVSGATAEIINQQTNLTIIKRTDTRGRFYQGLLAHGIYTMRVSATGFRTHEIVPVLVTLDPLPAATTSTTATASTSLAPQPAPSVLAVERTDVRAAVNSPRVNPHSVFVSFCLTKIKRSLSGCKTSRGER